MRRLAWSLAVALVGFYFGGKGGGDKGAILVALYGACVGYCIGAIVDRPRPTFSLIVYWAVLFTLIGPIVGMRTAFALYPDLSLQRESVAGAIGAIVGIMLGCLLGIAHQNWLRRRSEIQK